MRRLVPTAQFPHRPLCCPGGSTHSLPPLGTAPGSTWEQSSLLLRTAQAGNGGYQPTGNRSVFNLFSQSIFIEHFFSARPGFPSYNINNKCVPYPSNNWLNLAQTPISQPRTYPYFPHKHTFILFFTNSCPYLL